MATITVTFENGNLVMSDRGNTNASHSEQINWHPGSGVHSVTNVVAKSTSPKTTSEFWSNPPHKNGVNFRGTINGTVEGAWDYDISCNVGTNNDPEILTIDPRIQVL